MKTADIRTGPTAKIEIPVQFSRLRDVAYNLWWTWAPEAKRLFATIDRQRWSRYRNPIELLIDLEPERWHKLQADEEFIRAYRSVVEAFDAYLAPEEPTWFQRKYPDYDGGPIAYFSTEFGWHECLQIYSGGLGVLSGDHSKSASDLGLPFVGVGLMYKHGYFRQTIGADGQQQHFYPDYDLHRVPLLPVADGTGNRLTIALELPGRTLRVGVLKANVGRVPVLLLDSDLPENHPADRPITSILYVSGREMRLCQEIVLGLGGVEVLNALGIVPAAWHMNEGHSALLSLERIRREMGDGELSFDEAVGRISANAVFTTHTPVPAGNEVFDNELARKYLTDWAQRASIDVERIIDMGRAKAPHDDGSFNLTAVALRTSSHANGVSKLHGKVAGELWNSLLQETGDRKIEFVTNGVHLPTWIGREMGRVLADCLGEALEDRMAGDECAEVIEAIPAEALWQARSAQKKRLLRIARERALFQLARHGRSPDELRKLDHLLDPEVLLIGFARRFATYKRADLLLRDFDRLKSIIANDERPVQFLFAGKAHPADRPGQELIRKIWLASLDHDLKHRLLFIENYDMRFGRFMVQGVDVWLNNPRRPMEASGTSGMKAALNGALNCSVLDGWWCEGYDPSHGWIIGEKEPSDDHDSQDHQDAESLYRVLTDEIVPCYYDRGDDGLPHEWIRRMKRAVASLVPRFRTARMVAEYTENYYMPASGRVTRK